MANVNLTIPERDCFGHWLSGFVDGEGSFNLYFRRHEDRPGFPTCSPRATLVIKLRSDDRDILCNIRSYWGAGTLFDVPGFDNTSPRSTLTVTDRASLAGILVPHFIRYPLRAKKRADFLIWMEGVELICRCSTNTPAGRCRNTSRYTAQDIADFGSLIERLQSGRRFVDTLT